MSFWEKLLEAETRDSGDLDQNDARLQLFVGWPEKNQFIEFDTFDPSSSSKIVLSKKHWREITKREQVALWDQANQKGVTPISSEARRVAYELAKAVPDAVANIAQLEPTDVPGSLRDKVFSDHKPQSKNPAGADAMNQKGTPHQGYAGKSLKNSWEKLGELIR